MEGPHSPLPGMSRIRSPCAKTSVLLWRYSAVPYGRLVLEPRLRISAVDKSATRFVSYFQDITTIANQAKPAENLE